MKIPITYSKLIVLLVLYTSCFGQQATNNADQLSSSIAKYRNSNSLAGRYIRMRKILNASNSFDEIAMAIKQGKFYDKEAAEKGVLKWKYPIDSLEHYTIVIIPTDYNPLKQYPVDFILHGAASNPNPYAVDNYVKLSKSELNKIDKIVIYPASWLLSPWWSKRQLKNLAYLLRRIKKSYNVDENRVTLSGISDGGTGSVYVANYLITPWCCFLPYISNPISVSRLSEEELYMQNLGNRAFFFISTQEDPLFPPKRIQKFSSQMKKNGNPHQLAIVPDYGHNVKWFDNYRDSIKHFAGEHIRNPYPDSLNWYCHDTDYGRNHWVIIDKIGKKRISPPPDFILSNEDTEAIPYGSIQVVRRGNTVYVKTENVIKYRLLFSPEQFNFEKEIKVYTNGVLSYAGKPEKDPGVLLKWYWKDLDRSMLFASELKIRVK